MESKKVLYWLLGAIAINRLCSWAPAYVYFDPFPFYDIVDSDGNNIGITLQAYIYCISQHAIVMVLMYLVSSIAKYNLGNLVAKFFIIEIASLIDFFLIYEHSFIRIFSYALEFTDIKLALYTYFILRWKQ